MLDSSRLVSLPCENELLALSIASTVATHSALLCNSALELRSSIKVFLLCASINCLVFSSSSAAASPASTRRSESAKTVPTSCTARMGEQNDRQKHTTASKSNISSPNASSEITRYDT